MEAITTMGILIGILSIAPTMEHFIKKNRDKRIKKYKESYEKTVVDVYRYRCKITMVNNDEFTVSMENFTTDLFYEFLEGFIFKDKLMWIDDVYINPAHILKVELLETEAFKMNPLYNDEGLFIYSAYKEETVKARMVKEDNEGGNN